MNPDSGVYRGLERLKKAGFLPTGILDIGGYEGWWAVGARKLFPDAFIVILEAMPEKGPILGKVCRTIGNANYLISMLGETDANDAEFFVACGGSEERPIQTGSSKYPEQTSVKIQPRKLPQRCLRTIFAGVNKQFQLAKLDIQGAELEVLRGAGTLLNQLEVVLMEVGILPYNKGAPLFAEVIAAMYQLGFVVTDIPEEHRPFADQSLLQVDVIFTRADSVYRRKPPFT